MIKTLLFMIPLTITYLPGNVNTKWDIEDVKEFIEDAQDELNNYKPEEEEYQRINQILHYLRNQKPIGKLKMEQFDFNICKNDRKIVSYLWQNTENQKINLQNIYWPAGGDNYPSFAFHVWNDLSHFMESIVKHNQLISKDTSNHYYDFSSLITHGYSCVEYCDGKMKRLTNQERKEYLQLIGVNSKYQVMCLEDGNLFNELK